MSGSLGRSRTLVIGTRGSALALSQARRVAALIESAHPETRAELRVIRTEGDIDKTSPLTEIGGRGVFTSDLQAALIAGSVDVAVHSAKDLPARGPTETVLAAFPEREDPRDVVVSRHGVGLANLPGAPRIGTSSRRRAMQVLAVRPDAQIADLRGNVDTRLRKAEGDYDAVVLAAAGLARLGLTTKVTEWLAADDFVPAPGQGALAVEAREGDVAVHALLAAIDDPETALAVRAERAFLRALGAGCTTPLGVHVRREDRSWVLTAVFGEPTPGGASNRVRRAIDPDHAEAEAVAAARDLAERVERARPRRGGRVLVTRSRTQAEPLLAALRAAGADPLPFPTIGIVEPADPASLDAALARVRAGAFDWLAFTSANAVTAVEVRLRLLDCPPADLPGVRIAAVGLATANALLEHGFPEPLVATERTAEGLVAAMAAEGVAGARVLYPRGDLSRDALIDGLSAAGARVEDVEAYRTVPETDVDPFARLAVAEGTVDVVTFASPSSVRNLVHALGGDLSPLAGARVVCVGSVTAQAAAEHGLPPFAVADDPSVDGLVAAAMAALNGTTAGGPVRTPGTRPAQGDIA